MSRLPRPGQDNDVWGNILNDFLSVIHNDDGTLKSSSVAGKANDASVVHLTGDETVAGIKTFSSSPIVPTPTSASQATTKAYVDAAASAGTPDADATTKGKIQLAGDLGGTAAAPTVPSAVKKGDLVVNVKDYGALGNGSTDDTSAINAAIGALPSGGGVLYFPTCSSYYLITTGFTFSSKNNIAVRGAAGSEIRFAAGTTDTLYNSWPNYARDSIFRFVDCNDISIEGLKLNGNISNRTAHAPFESFNSCLTIAASNRVSINKCFITEGMTDGVIIMYNQGGTLSTQVTITNCEITKCRRNNVSLIGQDGAVLSDCLLDAAGSIQGISPKAGLDIEPDGAAGRSKNIIVQRNRISNNTGTYGMSVGGTGTSCLVISENILIANTTSALNIESSNAQVTVTSNIFSGHTAGIGVRTVGAGTDLIQGNVFHNNQYGISGPASADKLSIVGNKFINNNFDGIVLTSFVNVQIEGNTFTDNTSSTGDASGAGYALFATRTDANSIITFNNNILFNTAGNAFLMSGANVNAACNARANNNIGKNLKNNDRLIFNMTGSGNYSIDGSARSQSISAEANFDDVSTTTGGRLLIGSKYHYFGIDAPTTGTWQRGDIAYNTSPGIGKPLGWVCLTNGTPGTWLPYSALPNMSADRGNADVTLTVGTDSITQQFKTALTANRTITLSTTGAYDGFSFKIVRTGGDTGGPWVLSVGGLKNLSQNQWCEVQFDGAAWRLIGFGSLNAASTPTPTDVQTFTASGTWTKPAGAVAVRIMLLGGGGGGGSGRRGAASTIRCGGGGGGGGGYTDTMLAASELTATVAVTVGAGGNGGAAITTDSTSGSDGTSGGTTTFGAYVKAFGGTTGRGGTAASGAGGTGNIGTTMGANGGSASTTGGIGSTENFAGGGQGGSAGGGITSANTPNTAGTSGGVPISGVSNGLPGTVDGTLPTAGTNVTAGLPLPGGAGAGGSASVTTTAQSGTNGGLYGSGGGGGGASQDVSPGPGGNSGAGGAGASGIVRVITYF